MNVYAISAEGTLAVTQTEGHAVPPKLAREARTSEDPVSQARRHVAEAEARIERQQALVARLSDRSRYSSLAGQAREILGTLEQTLRLARDHLVDELSK